MAEDQYEYLPPVDQTHHDDQYEYLPPEQSSQPNDKSWLSQAYDSVKQQLSGNTEWKPNVDQEVAKTFENKFDPNVNAFDATESLFRSAGEIWSDDNTGKFWKTMEFLGLPGQAVARYATAEMAQLGLMDQKSARELLSQKDLHPSGLVDYYWKTASGPQERITRGAAGMAADILLDPLNFVGAGLTKAFKYAGKAIGIADDLSHLSTAEQNAVRAMVKIQKVVAADGRVLEESGKDAALVKKILNNNQAMIEENARRVMNDQREMTTLVSSLDVSPDAAQKIADIALKADITPGRIRQIADGERGLTIGARIPFTQLGFESEVPFINKFVSAPMGDMALTGLDKAGVAMKFASDAISKTPVVGAAARKAGDVYDAMSGVYDLMFTKTNNALFDESRIKFLGTQAVLRKSLKGREKYLRDLIEQDPQSYSRIRNWLETEPLMSDAELLKQYNKKAFVSAGEKATEEGIEYTAIRKSKDYNKLLEARKNADSIFQTMTDSERSLAKEILDENRAMVHEFESRNMKFEALNPFGEEGWATGYLKHIITDDFRSQMGERYSAHAQNVINSIMPGTVDRSALGRQFRKTIDSANEKSLQLYGVKMFVEDPIEAHMIRMKEMSNIINTHDFLKSIQTSAVPEHILKKLNSAKSIESVGAPRGFVPFDPEKYGRLVEARPKIMFNDGKVVKDVDGNIVRQSKGPIVQTFSQFVPEYLDSARNGGQIMHFSEDVAARIDWLLNPNRFNFDGPFGKAAALGLQGLEKLNYLFTNATLFGAGYQGQNFFSNIVTYQYAGGSNFRFIDALRVLPRLNKTANVADDVVFTFGKGANELSLTREELIHHMITDGAVGFSPKGITNEQLIEGIASSRKARSNVTKGMETAWDFMTLYKANRSIAEMADNLPRIAFYMSKLDEGYSLKGAAEQTRNWFHNFQDMSPGQRVVQKVIPFSSFAMKTIEQTVHNAKEGRLAYMTLPKKVRDTLDGAYVEDYETRQNLRAGLPSWRQDDILGPLLPGGRQVLFQLPWALASSKIIFDNVNVHPFMKWLGLSFGKHQQELSKQMEENDQKKMLDDAVHSFMPDTFKHALFIWQQKNPDQDTIFSRKFANDQSFMYRMSGGDAYDSPKAYEWLNSVNFGEYLDKAYGNNWAYNLFFHADPSGRTKYQDQLLNRSVTGTNANYVSSHFRDLALGFANIEPLDKDFFLKQSSMIREERRITRDLEKELQIAYAGRAMNMQDLVSDEDRLKAMLGSQDLSLKSKQIVSEILALRDKQEALNSMYSFAIADRKGGAGILDAIFDVDGSKIKEKAVVKENAMRFEKNSKNYLNVLKKEKIGSEDLKLIFPQEGPQGE